MSKFLSFETENQWIKSDSYDPDFEYFRGGDYGCMWLYRDKKTDRGYWMKDGLFMSAPLFKYGTPDLDHVDYLSNWEDFETINFSNLIEILEKLVKQQEVK
tara:strand:- start:6051 stop:6353 length:303 start_codon:yes stop_codon:yes gene_type:complete